MWLITSNANCFTGLLYFLSGFASFNSVDENLHCNTKSKERARNTNIYECHCMSMNRVYHYIKRIQNKTWPLQTNFCWSVWLVRFYNYCKVIQKTLTCGLLSISRQRKFSFCYSPVVDTFGSEWEWAEVRADRRGSVHENRQENDKHWKLSIGWRISTVLD